MGLDDLFNALDTHTYERQPLKMKMKKNDAKSFCLLKNKPRTHNVAALKIR